MHARFQRVRRGFFRIGRVSRGPLATLLAMQEQVCDPRREPSVAGVSIEQEQVTGGDAGAPRRKTRAEGPALPARELGCLGIVREQVEDARGASVVRCVGGGARRRCTPTRQGNY